MLRNRSAAPDPLVAAPLLLQADAEFERERCNRLLEQQGESRRQAEELLTRNGQYQAMVTNLQVRRAPAFGWTPALSLLRHATQTSTVAPSHPSIDTSCFAAYDLTIKMRRIMI